MPQPEEKTLKLWSELASLTGDEEEVVSREGPVYVQEVYIMDGFLRALAEFRSPQEEGQMTVPVPCMLDESLENVKRRIFDRVRENFVALQELSNEEKMKKWGPMGIFHYKWIDRFFSDKWSEDDLKWFVYQEYDYYLDPKYWKLYGPDLVRPTELYDELKVSRAKDSLRKHDGSGSFQGAIYLLATHVRVMLFRNGFPNLMYTLDRETSFTDLKALVETDVGDCFSSFPIGPPGNVFGPGKSLSDVVDPTTVGISHAWA